MNFNLSCLHQPKCCLCLVFVIPINNTAGDVCDFVTCLRWELCFGGKFSRKIVRKTWTQKLINEFCSWWVGNITSVSLSAAVLAKSAKKSKKKREKCRSECLKGTNIDANFPITKRFNSFSFGFFFESDFNRPSERTGNRQFPQIRRTKWKWPAGIEWFSAFFSFLFISFLLEMKMLSLTIHILAITKTQTRSYIIIFYNLQFFRDFPRATYNKN